MARTIVKRTMRHPFEGAPIARHWVAGSAVATHIINGVNLLFPAGERFFVRSVNRFKQTFADDPKLSSEVRAFFGQEGQHAREHERYFDVLRDQGYEIERFLKVYTTLAFGVVETHAPAKLALAATAAAEHFTAVMAEQALTYRWLDEMEAPQVMRDLLLWHAVEEIEHRAVAYEVLQRVDDRWWLRAAGMAVAASMLSGFWLAGTLTLLRQDGVGARRLLAELQQARRRRAMITGDEQAGLLRDVFIEGIREYLRPNFHPEANTQADAVAARYVAERGLKAAPSPAAP